MGRIMILNMNKIAFITIYFGEKPKFLKYFLQTAKNNVDYDFYILSDWDSLPINSENIFHKPLLIDEFSNFAIEKGILNKKLENPYKLCDLKPAWFHIIEDFLDTSSYNFIGYIDIDLILGNLNSFITAQKLEKYDILTISPNFMSGVMTLFKNNQRNKLLYRSDESWKYIFNHPDSFAFDEDFSFRKQILKNHPSGLKSFSDIVAKEEKEGLRVFHGKLVSYGLEDEIISYYSGSLLNNLGKEYILYNFVYVKHNFLWYFPNWNFLPEKFYINKFGFYRKKYLPIKRYNFFCTPPYCIQTFQKIYHKKHRFLYHLKHNSLLTVFKSL